MGGSPVWCRPTPQREEPEKSLRAYLREVFTEHVAAPSMERWLRNLQELGPAHLGGPTGAELVAADRAEDDELVAR